MTRKEFEEALLPLTPSEEKYKKNPYYLNTQFSDYIWQQQQNNDNRFKFIEKMENNILPNLNSVSPFLSSNITLNRHDRFAIIPVHTHGYIEMNYVFQGNCTTQINQKKVRLSTGDICIMDRNASHTILPTGETDIILNIMLSCEYFSSSFLGTLLNGGPVAKFLSEVISENNEHNQYLVFHTKRSLLVKELIGNIFIEYLNPGICCADVLRHNLSLLFIELARCYQGHMERKLHKRSKAYMTEILNYMENHCTDCTLEDVAKQFNFHPNYLSRLLKIETGANFQDILCEIRMNRVVFLLQNSELPIYKIAADCGYLNQSFFRKKFMERYGQTPNQYRMSKSTP